MVASQSVHGGTPRNGGKVARLDLVSASFVQTLDLNTTHADLAYGCGGFTDGVWGYVLPSRGKVGRFNLPEFSTMDFLDSWRHGSKWCRMMGLRVSRARWPSLASPQLAPWRS